MDKLLRYRVLLWGTLSLRFSSWPQMPQAFIALSRAIQKCFC